MPSSSCAERMSPQSVEEVEALEKKLQDGLEELRARKEQLRGREGGSKSLTSWCRPGVGPARVEFVTMRVEVAGAEYRAGSAYRFVPVDRLTAEQQAAVGNLADDPEIYAVLIPLSTGTQTVKAIDQQTALVYLTLREPGPLPSSMRAAFRDELPAAIARLVLDGVLEIRNGEDFVSDGCRRAPERAPPTKRAARPAGAVVASGAAIRAAPGHPRRSDARGPSLRLQSSGPHSRLGPTTADAGGDCGLSRPRGRQFGAVAQPRLRVAQRATTASSWLAWRSSAPISADGAIPGYKLYVSPQPSAAAESLRITAEVVRSGVRMR